MNYDFLKKNTLYLFIIFSFLILGFLISVNYFSAKNLQNEFLNQFDTHRDLLLEKSAFNIERNIFERKNELKLLEKKIVLNEIEFNSCKKNPFSFLNNNNNNNNLDNYFIIDRKGNIISCSNPKYLDLLNLNIKNTNYFKNTLKNNEITINPIKTSSPGQIYIIAPFNSNLKNISAILTIIEINNLYSKYIHELVSNGNFYYIYDLTDNSTIMQSSNFDKNLIQKYIKINETNLIKNENKIILINKKNYIFNKKKLLIGDNVWEIGIFSSTLKINSNFNNLNFRHILSIIFILIILIILFFIMFNFNRLKINSEKKFKKFKITLEDYGIKFDFEENFVNSISKEKLKNGLIYLCRNDEIQAEELFIKTISQNYIGLGFIRDEINKFKNKFNLKNTSLIKLSKEENKNCEINIKIISKLICDFIGKNIEKKVVYIDSLDYIILENGFKQTLKELYILKDKIKNSKSILIFSINQNVISQRELLALEEEFIDIKTEEKKTLENISELELKILQFINNLNNNKIQVRYKDISKEFNITKPTTAKKIFYLEKKNLIEIEEIGRNKLIKISLKGRKII